VVTGALSSTRFRVEALESQVSNDSSTAVGLANYLVKEHGVSFRQAHTIVGELARMSADSGEPLQSVASSKLQAVSFRLAGKRIAIDRNRANEILDARRFLESIRTEGGSNPAHIAKELKIRKVMLRSTRAAVARRRSSLKASERKLFRTSSGIAREVKTRSER